MKTWDEIEALFGYHAGTDETQPLHTGVRQTFMDTAKELDNLIPEDAPGAARLKALMHTKLEEAAMWANKAVAIAAPVVQEVEKVVEDVQSGNEIQAVEDTVNDVQTAETNLQTAEVAQDQANN